MIFHPEDAVSLLARRKLGRRIYISFCVLFNGRNTVASLSTRYLPPSQELQKFAVFIIRRFIEVAQKNRKAYMELLFWKTTRDATEVVEGYNAETDNKKVSRNLWTETQEDELRTLFMEHQTNKYPQGTLPLLDLASLAMIYGASFNPQLLLDIFQFVGSGWPDS